MNALATINWSGVAGFAAYVALWLVCVAGWSRFDPRNRRF